MQVGFNGSAFDLLARAVGIDEPYLWQHEVYGRLVVGDVPGSIVVPTAAGKTMTLVAFVAALATQAASGAQVTLPRRLVHVVNRRILVDESTRLAQRMADALETDETLSGVRKALASLSATGVPLSVSTLRGGTADNGAWALDPSTPALILATPDMLGSRLLFRGYGLGRSRGATHGGLLGCDTLIIHDEAHLAPAFTSLLRQVEVLSSTGAKVLNRPPLQVVEMTATLGGDLQHRPLVCDVSSDARLRHRMSAAKRLSLLDVTPPPGKADKPHAAVLEALVSTSLSFKDSDKAVAVFVSSPAVAGRIADRLVKAGVKDSRILLLTGTLRGYERAGLTTTDAFRRFDPGHARVHGETAYFIATSAGEIGLDIDADVGLFDLTTVDRFIQRCGRVNRRGQMVGDISLIHASGVDLPEPMVKRSVTALHILESLAQNSGYRDASPLALSRLCQHESYQDAVDPPPAMRVLEPAVVAMLSMTSFRLDEIQCPQPDVYIHGLVEDDAQIGIAWRELPRAGSDFNQWLEVWPLMPAEMARMPIEAVQRLIRTLLLADAADSVSDGLIALVLDAQGLPVAGGEFAHGQHVNRWVFGLRPGQTVLLASQLGGLNSQGLPTPDATEPVADVSALSHAGLPELPNAMLLRLNVFLSRTDDGTVWSVDQSMSTETAESGSDEKDADADTGTETKHLEASSVDALLVQVLPDRAILFHDAPSCIDRSNWNGMVRVWLSDRVVRSADSGDLSSMAPNSRLLEEHLALTAQAASRIAAHLKLGGSMAELLVHAGAEHDRGKQWSQWQLAIGNTDTNFPLGKSSGSRFNFSVNAGYRHELGSVVDVGSDLNLVQTHLVASHHGWGRPGYRDAALSHPGCQVAADQVARGFADLNESLGPWAVCYLEALLKSADILAEVRATDLLAAPRLPAQAPGSTWLPHTQKVSPDVVHVEVDVTNFGEYLAALGLAALVNQTGRAITFGWSEAGLEIHGVSDQDVLDCLSVLCAAKVRSDRLATTPKQMDGAYPPLLLSLPTGQQMPMNHWLDGDFQTSSDWKLAAGQTSAVKTLNSLLSACGRSLNHSDFCLTGLFGFGGRKVDADSSKFRFDAATNWSAQDAGFSLNEADVLKSTRPWVELLSALGLQYFFLPPADQSKRYFVWDGQLAPSLALAAVKGLLPQCTQGYEPVIEPSGKMKDVFTSKLVVRERKPKCQSVIRVI